MLAILHRKRSVFLKNALCLTTLLLAVAACGHKDSASGARPASTAIEARSDAEKKDYLAYEHAVTFDVEESKIAAMFETAQSTCRQAAADQCVLLESKISSGRHAHASVVLRAKPAGVRNVIAALSKDGEVTERSTTAEDIAKPIEDTVRKLDMLNDYRGKLEALRARAAADVDALIKVNRELAEVQSQIEALNGQRAWLKQRVDTEILRISIQSQRQGSFWQPVSVAFADFGSNLSYGISSLVLASAYLAPWLVLIALCIWIFRRVKSRRAKNRTML